MYMLAEKLFHALFLLFPHVEDLHALSRPPVLIHIFTQTNVHMRAALKTSKHI